MLPPLQLSCPSRAAALRIETPMVLAPMAGITNAAYRQLCREQGAGLCICEMITSQALVMRDRKTLSMLEFSATEQIRSVQLYGVDPGAMAAAAEILCEEFSVNHIDLNFGCPVPKVTRKGGGGVLPYKRDRLRAILAATVTAADRYGVPVTMKTRKGIDDEHLTYLDAGRIAAETGCAAMCLHGRTVQESYSGCADWQSIATLVKEIDIPVLGNGDIWEAKDAVRMVEETGVAGVVVGRGCLGRPWLFRDLAQVCQGKNEPTLPTLGDVIAMAIRHGELLTKYQGEFYGCRDLRKHLAWYFKGFAIGGELRRQLGMISSLDELVKLLAVLDPQEPYPVAALGKARGRQGSSRNKVAMPDGWLSDTCGLDLDLGQAELADSGG